MKARRASRQKIDLVGRPLVSFSEVAARSLPPCFCLMARLLVRKRRHLDHVTHQSCRGPAGPYEASITKYLPSSIIEPIIDFATGRRFTLPRLPPLLIQIVALHLELRLTSWRSRPAL